MELIIIIINLKCVLENFYEVTLIDKWILCTSTIWGHVNGIRQSNIKRAIYPCYYHPVGHRCLSEPFSLSVKEYQKWKVTTEKKDEIWKVWTSGTMKLASLDSVWFKSTLSLIPFTNTARYIRRNHRRTDLVLIRAVLIGIIICKGLVLNLCIHFQIFENDQNTDFQICLRLCSSYICIVKERDPIYTSFQLPICYWNYHKTTKNNSFFPI